MKPEIIRIDLEGVNCYLGKENGNFILFDTGGHLFLDKIENNRRQALINGLEKAGCQRSIYYRTISNQNCNPCRRFGAGRKPYYRNNTQEFKLQVNNVEDCFSNHQETDYKTFQ